MKKTSNSALSIIALLLMGIFFEWGLSILNVHEESKILESEIAQINKTFAHRERIVRIYSDRLNYLKNQTDFLKIQLSETFIRLSIIEQQRHIEVVISYNFLAIVFYSVNFKTLSAIA